MKIIGHRGARGLAPENTRESLRQALENHCDEVEFDVRVTKDGVPVLSHDPAISIGQKEFSISHHTLTQLLQRKPDLLTLDQALGFMKNQSRSHIEIKSSEPVQPIVATIQKHLENGDCNLTNLSVASFDQQVLLTVKGLLPGVETVVIERWSGLRAAWRARQLHTKRISMNQRWLWRGFLKSMYRHGYQLTPYTINNPAQAQKWEPYLYGIITDYPDRFNSSDSSNH